MGRMQVVSRFLSQGINKNRSNIALSLFLFSIFLTLSPSLTMVKAVVLGAAGQYSSSSSMAL